MKDFFYLMFISVALVLISRHNFKESNDMLYVSGTQSKINLSTKTKKMLLIRKEGSVSFLGLLYHIINTYVVFFSQPY